MMLCYYSLVTCVDHFFHCHFFSSNVYYLPFFIHLFTFFVVHLFFVCVFVSSSTSLGNIVALCVGVGTWNYQSFKPSFCLVSPFFFSSLVLFIYFIYFILFCLWHCMFVFFVLLFVYLWFICFGGCIFFFVYLSKFLYVFLCLVFKIIVVYFLIWSYVLCVWEFHNFYCIKCITFNIQHTFCMQFFASWWEKKKMNEILYLFLTSKLEIINLKLLYCNCFSSICNCW